MPHGSETHGEKRARQKDQLVMDQVWDRSQLRASGYHMDLTNVKSVRRFKLSAAQINKFTEENAWDRAERWARLTGEFVFASRLNHVREEARTA
jgi:hypothetical protein